MPFANSSLQRTKRAHNSRKEAQTHSFCIALTTAFENGAEVAIFALIARSKDLFTVVANIPFRSMPSKLPSPN
jgi:hypothetical protein